MTRVKRENAVPGVELQSLNPPYELHLNAQDPRAACLMRERERVRVHARGETREKESRDVAAKQARECPHEYMPSAHAESDRPAIYLSRRSHGRNITSYVEYRCL